MATLSQVQNAMAGEKQPEVKQFFNNTESAVASESELKYHIFRLVKKKKVLIS